MQVGGPGKGAGTPFRVSHTAHQTGAMSRATRDGKNEAASFFIGAAVAPLLPGRQARLLFVAALPPVYLSTLNAAIHWLGALGLVPS